MMQEAMKGGEHFAIDGAVSMMNAQPSGAATVNTSDIHGSEPLRLDSRFVAL